MSEIKWIKVTTEMFDDDKINIIEQMPDADTILVIWLKILIMAGKKNAGGWIYFNEKVPYTEEMLAVVFRRNLPTVRLALATFQKFGMIEIVEDQGIYITNWEKHQNIEGMERVRQLTRDRTRQYRLRQIDKQQLYLTSPNATVTSHEVLKDDITNENEAVASHDVTVTEQNKNKIRIRKEEEKKNIEKIWSYVLSLIENEIAGQVYKTYFEKTTALEKRNGQFIINTPNEFIAEYIMKNQSSLVERLLSGEIGERTQLLAVCVGEQ